MHDGGTATSWILIVCLLICSADALPYVMKAPPKTAEKPIAREWLNPCGVGAEEHHIRHHATGPRGLGLIELERTINTTIFDLNMGPLLNYYRRCSSGKKAGSLPPLGLKSFNDYAEKNKLNTRKTIQHWLGKFYMYQYQILAQIDLMDKKKLSSLGLQSTEDGRNKSIRHMTNKATKVLCEIQIALNNTGIQESRLFTYEINAEKALEKNMQDQKESISTTFSCIVELDFIQNWQHTLRYWKKVISKLTKMSRRNRNSSRPSNKGRKTNKSRKNMKKATKPKGKAKKKN